MRQYAKGRRYGLIDDRGKIEGIIGRWEGKGQQEMKLRLQIGQGTDEAPVKD